MGSFLGSVLIVGGMLYGAVCAYVFFMQAKLIYYPNMPSRVLTASPRDVGLDFESVTITTSDRIKLHGWFVPAQQERGVLLFFHGNAGNISHRLDLLKIFHNLGLSSLIIDYRGYGQSQGKITEQGTYLDAEAAWQYLTRGRNVPAEKIVIFGMSLGGAIAANLAARQQPAALILGSSFTSVPDMGAHLYPILPVRLLSRFRYDTRESLKSVTCPVLVIHSPDDEIIPFINGSKLFEAAKEPKSFLEIHGGHNDGFLTSGKLYVDGLDKFINTFLKPTS
jgi:fermentation-respiration switch protein FrsA (DUF1100 family)